MRSMYQLQSLKPRRDDSRLRKILLLLAGGGLVGSIILYVLNWWRRRCVRALPPGEPNGAVQQLQELQDSGVPRSISEDFIRAVVGEAATAQGAADVATRGQRVSWNEWRSFCGRVLLKHVTATAVIDFPYADAGVGGLNLTGDERLLERAYVFDDPSLNADAAKEKETRVVLHVHTLVKWGDRKNVSADKRALKVTSVNVRFAARAKGGDAGTFVQDTSSMEFILPQTDKLKLGAWQRLFRDGKGKEMEWSWKDVLNDARNPLPSQESRDAVPFYKEVARVIQLGERLCAQGKWFCEAGSLVETNKAIRGGGEWEVVVPEHAPPVLAPRVSVPEHALLEMMDLLNIVSDEFSDDALEEDEGQDVARKVHDLQKLFDGISNGDIVPTCVIDFPYADNGKSESALNLKNDDRLLERMYCFYQKGLADTRILVKAHTLLCWGDRIPLNCNERAMFVTAVNVRHATRSPGSRHFDLKQEKHNLVPVGQNLQKGKWREIYKVEKEKCEQKGQKFQPEDSSLTWKWNLEASIPSAELGGEKVSEMELSRYRGTRGILKKGETICRNCEPIETFTERRCEIVGFRTEDEGMWTKEDATQPKIQQKEEQHQGQLVEYRYPSAPPPAFETDGAIRVLFLGINTKGQVQINVNEEHRKIFNGMYEALRERMFHRVYIHADYFTDPDEFLRKLRSFQPSILHFGCHGQEEGLHFFDNFVKRKDLAGVLRGASVRVIVVNACHSLETAKSLSKAVDFVVGFDEALPDAEAIGFSGTLYSELAGEKSLEEAFKKATLSSSRHNYRLLAKEYDPSKMIIFDKPKPAQALNLRRMYAHIMVQQAPVLTSMGSEVLEFHDAIDKLQRVLEKDETGMPDGHTCLTDGKKKLAWEYLANTSLHVLVWSAKGTGVALQEGWGVLSPPPPSEEHINVQHICSALGRMPECLRPKIIFVCHCHGARATAELLRDEGVAGAVVWIGSDLLSMPELLKRVILQVCTSSQEDVEKELRHAAESVFKSEWESKCGIAWGKHVKRNWDDKCGKRNVSTALTCRKPPARLFQHFQEEDLKPLSYDTDSIAALKNDLIDIADSDDSERIIHVVAEEGLECGHAASRCRSVAGQACLATLCAGGSGFRNMFLVETSADVKELREEVSRQEGGKRCFYDYSMLVWIDLTSASRGDELLSALKELVKTFPRLVGVLTSAAGEQEHAERIIGTLPITERRYVQAIPSGERTAKADSLHEEIKFTFLDVSSSVKLSPLETFDTKSLWLSIKEALKIGEQKQRPVACLYAGDDSSLLVRICISDVGYLHGLRDQILLGTVQERLAQSLNERRARMKGDGDVRVEVDLTYFAESYGDIVLCLETLTAHQQDCISQCRDSENIHVMAPAGAGKTFIALHLVLESINAWLKQGSSQKGFVLFVANNQGMALSFATWLCAKVKVLEDTSLHATIRRAMSHLHFMFEPFCKGPYSVSIKQDGSGGQMLVLQEIQGSAPESYSVVVVDEAHHVYCGLSAADRSFVDKHVPLQPQKDTRRILLSDISQSDGRVIQYPEGLVTVKLTEVVRSTKRIVLGAMSFQLFDGEGQNQTRCQHDAVGPHMKALLFPPSNAAEGTPEWYSMYAARVQEALASFVLMKYPGMNLHNKLAILVPDKDFRDRLKPALEEQLVQHGISLVDVVKASRSIQKTVPKRVKQSQQEVVLDTVDEFDGLERLIVLVVGLDKAGSATGGEDIVRETRSRFYRAVTRAHMQVVVVNVFVRDGWLEFLGYVSVDKETEFNEDVEFHRLKEEAARKAVICSKECVEKAEVPSSVEEDSSGSDWEDEVHKVNAGTYKPAVMFGEQVQPVSKKGLGAVALSPQKVDEFPSNVWDSSACCGLVLRPSPGWSPQKKEHIEKKERVMTYVTVIGPVAAPNDGEWEELQVIMHSREAREEAEYYMNDKIIEGQTKKFGFKAFFWDIVDDKEYFVSLVVDQTSEEHFECSSEPVSFFFPVPSAGVTSVLSGLAFRSKVLCLRNRAYLRFCAKLQFADQQGKSLGSMKFVTKLQARAESSTPVWGSNLYHPMEVSPQNFLSTIFVFPCKVGTGAQVHREGKKIAKYLRERDFFCVETNLYPSPQDFADCIGRCTRDNIVGLHFVGHTNETGEVVFVGKISRSMREPMPEAFSSARYVEQMRLGSETTLQFVFLNASESVSLGQRLVECGVAYVICWVGPVPDSVALKFCKRFYKYLGANPGKYGSGFQSAACMQTTPKTRRRLPCLLWRDGASGVVVDEGWNARMGMEGACAWMDERFVPLSSIEEFMPGTREEESSDSEGGGLEEQVQGLAVT